jgi:hypothetical protein
MGLLGGPSSSGPQLEEGEEEEEEEEEEEDEEEHGPSLRLLAVQLAV